ncbi:unnamed protein product [Prunus armeniaca]
MENMKRTNRKGNWSWINPKYAKLRRKGISPDMEEKFDRMFMNTTATGDHAWAPSSGVLPTHDSFECDGILLDSGDDSDDLVYVLDETIQVTGKFCGKGKKRTNQQLDTHTTTKKEKHDGNSPSCILFSNGRGIHRHLFHNKTTTVNNRRCQNKKRHQKIKTDVFVLQKDIKKQSRMRIDD